MYKGEYIAEAKDGELKIQNLKGWKKDIEWFDGKKVKITIEVFRPKRSNGQNRYFHGVVIPIIQAHLLDMGWEQARSSAWVKDYIKLKCLLVEDVDPLTGEVIHKLGETSGLTRGEFMDFVAVIQQFCSEHLDLYVPDPNEQVRIDI